MRKIWLKARNDIKTATNIAKQLTSTTLIKKITQKKSLMYEAETAVIYQMMLCDLNSSLKLRLVSSVSVYERVLVQKQGPVNYTLNETCYYIESNTMIK